MVYYRHSKDDRNIFTVHDSSSHQNQTLNKCSPPGGPQRRAGSLFFLSCIPPFSMVDYKKGGRSVSYAGDMPIWRMVIVMLFKDIQHHNKPHILVYYGDYEASIGLDGEMLAGSLPAKQFKIVVGWILFHEEELYKAWNLAVQGEHFDKIKPL